MIDIEKQVIASILVDGRVMRDVAMVCAPVDFADKRLGDIFAGMGRMYAEREPIDPITVSGHLLEWGVRGISEVDLFAWTSEVPHAQNAGRYAELVRRGAMQRGANEIAARIRTGLQEMGPELVISRAMEDLRSLQEEHTVDELTAMTLDELLQADVEYDWVIDGLLERKDRLMLTGAEGGGKSTLIRQMAITAASGIHPFREYPIEPARVLVVDVENTAVQWGRETRKWARSVEQLGAADPNRNMHVSCVRRLDLTKDMDLGLVHRLVDQHRPDVLFIGPLYKLVPRAINSDDEASPLLASLDTLRDRGLALVIEAHAGHATNPAGERDMRPRGSAALMGWPEFGYGLRKNRKNPLHVDMVRWRGDRDSRGWPSKLGRSNVPDGQRWPWRPVDG